MANYEVEKYFFDTDVLSNDDKKLILIIYDISSTKKRNRLIKILEEYGVRVQKSAFEAQINDIKLAKLVQKIERRIKIEENDNIRIYKINKINEVVAFGNSSSVTEDLIIV